MHEYERLERRLVAKGAIIDYYQDKVKVPNGNVVTWDFIGHRGAAAVIPILEDGRILMVRQYRNALERETLEIPAGGLENTEESTHLAASRELEEETGYTSQELKFLISIRTTVAFCDEKIDIYMARNLRKTQQNLDEDEFIRVAAYSLEELCQMIFQGKIEDAKTISAIMSYRALISNCENTE